MDIKVLKRDGSDSGRTITLDDSVFGIEPNEHAIWLDVRSIQAAGRQGTHKTKERAEVAYSTRKLYRQKGTGGTIFGPKPHKYSVGVNRKTKQLARRSVLSFKAQNDALRVVENVAFDAPKTREMADMLMGLQLGNRKVLMLTTGYEDALYKSARNLPGVRVMPATSASTLDLMEAQIVLMLEGAIEALTETLKKSAPEAAAA
jgi:large subunit ribosomal protein L4